MRLPRAAPPPGSPHQEAPPARPPASLVQAPGAAFFQRSLKMPKSPQAFEPGTARAQKRPQNLSLKLWR
eukprot:15438493-Alexandrium_andersonii.AAC.1